MFTGVLTALVTPFKNNQIDYETLEKIIKMQIENDVDGIVIMGTTGESPTVSFEEHKECIRRAITLAGKKTKIIAGTGSNSTEEAIYLSRAADEDGADGILLVNPYYNKPPQRGMIAHFEAIAQSVSLPVILYNIPGRTGVNLSPESILTLVENNKNIVSVKEASGDLSQMMRIIELCGDRITLLSGDDNILLPVLSIGGAGVISVLSNILPTEMKKVITNYNNGNIEESRNMFYRLLPLCRAMFLETNPIPIKAAMEMLGYCSSELRLPMVSLSDENRKKLKEALSKFGLKV